MLILYIIGQLFLDSDWAYDLTLWEEIFEDFTSKNLVAYYSKVEFLYKIQLEKTLKCSLNTFKTSLQGFLH